MKKLLTLLFVGVAFSLNAAEAVKIYIAQNGDNKNAGTLEAPLASLEGARAKIEAMAKADGGEVKSPVEVFIREGVYYFRDTVLLDKNLKFKSGSALTIAAYENEKVTFHGGVKIAADKLKKVTNKSILAKLPPEKADGALYALDLKAEGVTDYGVMKKHGFGAVDVSPMEVFYNKNPLYLARYPNVGCEILEIGKVIDDGSIPNEKTGKPQVVRGATFTYEYDRANRWADLKNVWLFGKFSYGYCDDNLRIEKIDTKEKTIKLVDRHSYKVAPGAKHIRKQGREYWEVAGLEVRGYCAYNMLEEADKDGEYFIDRDTGIFYVILKDEPKGVFEFSILENPFVAIYNNSNVNIKNIDFTCSRGLGVIIRQSQDICIDKCDFYNLGTVAVSTWAAFQSNMPIRLRPHGGSEISNLNENIKIKNCKIFNTGTGGVTLAGGDRKTLKKSNNLIENCELFNNSRVNNTYSPAVHLTGCGSSIANCYIHDEPHMAILFQGNDFIIKRNMFARLCDNFDDMGPVYTGRNPTERGTIIEENFFTDILPKHKNSNMCGIYIDDGSGGITINRNIFCKVGNSPENSGNIMGAIYIHGGFDNYIKNNVFVDCVIWAGHHHWTEERWVDYTISEFLPKTKAVDARSALYQKVYPELEMVYRKGVPRNNYAMNNKIFRCNGILAGRFTMGGNRIIRRDNIPEIPAWTLDDVKKHLGDDNLVGSILQKQIGLLPQK